MKLLIFAALAALAAQSSAAPDSPKSDKTHRMSLDADGSGSVSYSEAAAFNKERFERRFSKADANGDKKLDGNEIKKFIKHGKGKAKGKAKSREAGVGRGRLGKQAGKSPNRI